MIVKNELEVLKNALDSIVDHLDYWVIGDTGSDDGTQEFIKTYFEEKDIPGELFEDEWVNFAQNRELVFRRAQGKADYLVTLDADEIFVPLTRKNEPQITKRVKKLPVFKKDLVRVYTHLQPWVYKRAQFFKGDLPWRWAEGLHEYPYCEAPHEEEIIETIGIFTEGGGDRGKQADRVMKDIQVLEEALKEEPSARNYYNLGMTQQGRGDYEAAITAYDNCIRLTSWDEESYLAYISKGLCLHWSNRPNEAMLSFASGTEVIPHRPEAHYHLAEQYFHKKQFILARTILEAAMKLPFPKKDLSLVDVDVIRWKIPDVLSLCYFEEKKAKLAYKTIKKVLTDSNVRIMNKLERQRLEANFALFKRVAQLPRKYKREINQ